MQMNSDYDYLVKRGVQEIIHFTAISNLEKIAKEGLIPRDQLEDGTYDLNVDHRSDGYGHVNTSITYPNINLFWYSRKKSYKIYAILSLNPEFLNSLAPEDYDFVDLDEKENRFRSVSVEALFDGVRFNFPENCSTSNQAKLVIKKPIKPNVIQAIYLEDEFHQESVQELFPNVPVIVDKGKIKFGYHKVLMKPDELSGAQSVLEKNKLEIHDLKVASILETYNVECSIT